MVTADGIAICSTRVRASRTPKHMPIAAARITCLPNANNFVLQSKYAKEKPPGLRTAGRVLPSGRRPARVDAAGGGFRFLACLAGFGGGVADHLLQLGKILQEAFA